MATLQPGLFGYDPTQLQQAEQQRLATLYGQAGSPYEKMGMALGQLGGAAVKGLFNIEDPAISANKEATALAAQYDLYSAAGLKEYTTALQQRAQETGNPALAAIVPRAAAEYQKALLNEATIADKLEKKTPNIGEQVNQQLFAKFKQDAIKQGVPADQVDMAAAMAYDKYEKDSKVRVAAAGVAPAPGQVPLTVLGQAQDIADKYTAKPKARLENIGGIVAIAKQVKTNPTVLPQFQRELVKLAGDSQIGQNEVKNILGSAGFGADVIDGVNKFLTGAPTNTKIDDVLRGVKAIEQYTAKQYETGRKKAERVLAQGKIDPETKAAVLPDPYGVKKPIPSAAPSLSEFLAKAKIANPNTTEADLTAYYNTKYGKK